MKAVLFPHTDPPDAWAEPLKALFGEVFVYRPDHRPPEGKTAAFSWVLWPEEDSARLEAEVRAWTSWAAQHHRGAGMAAAWRAMTDDRHVAEEPGALAARIRGRGQEGGAEGGEQALRTARVLLLLAERADRERREAARILAHSEAQRKRLVAAITGDPHPPAEPAANEGAEETLGQAAARLFCWARLYLARPAAATVFITASPAAFSLLEERLAGAARRPAAGPAGALDGPLPRLRELLEGVSRGRIPLSSEPAGHTAAAAVGSGMVGLLAFPGVFPPQLLEALLDPRRKLPAEEASVAPQRGVTILLQLPLPPLG